ncbi:hypothetical protein Tco_0967546 [Tanacetum coccineum]
MELTIYERDWIEPWGPNRTFQLFWYDALHAEVVDQKFKALDINALALSDRHPTYHETPSDQERLEKHGKVFNWETAKYDKIWYDEDVHDLKYVETEFSAIVFNDTLTSEVTLSCEPTVSPLNDDEIVFRVSFDDSDDEDYTDKINMPSFPSPEPTVNYFSDFDFLKDFEKEFTAIAYNDALTSNWDFLTEPTMNPQHIDEFNLKDETS